MIDALTVVAMVCGGFFLVGGVGQVVGRWVPRTPAVACGFSPGECRVIGVLEVFGGAGLLIAYYFPAVAAIAALGLFLLTLAAYVYHNWYQQRGLRLWAPVVVALLMLTVAAGLPLSSSFEL
ncbi:DoxX family protein [Streptomyces sp. P5-A9]|uniref:DoxX family protein n=1 Tax=Streptomyces sp. P5-A9 TaxID=3071730 RepID=UPI002FC759B8